MPSAGALIFETKIDTSPFKSQLNGMKGDLKSLEKALAETNREANQLGKKLATNPGDSGLKKQYQDTLDAGGELYKQIEELQTKISEMEPGNALADELDKAQGEYQKLIEKQQTMNQLGVDPASSSYQRLQMQIDAARTKVEDLSNSFSAYDKEATGSAQTRISLWNRVEDALNSAGQDNSLQNQIDATQTKYDKLIAKQQKMKDLGKDVDSPAWKSLQYDIDLAKAKLDELNAKQAGTTASEPAAAAAATPKVSTPKTSGIQSLLGNVFNSAATGIKNFNTGLFDFFRKGNQSDGMAKSLTRSIFSLGNMFKVMGIRMLMRAAFREMQAGMQSLIQYSAATANSVGMIKNSLTAMSGSLAAAVAPVLNFLAPVISKVIDMFTTAANAVAMFFAALTGKKYVVQAVKSTNNYAAALGNTASGASNAAKAQKEENKEVDKATASFDELNQLNLQKTADTTPDTGSGGGSGSGGASTGAFVTKDVDMTIPERLQKLLDAARDTLEKIKQLVSDIGKSFQEVWSNGTGQHTLDDIYQILMNIIVGVGNLAVAIDKAWVQGGTGTRIIQAWWNMLNDVLDMFVSMTGALADFNANLDLSPLLTSFAAFSEALEVVVNLITDGLAWAFSNILLPFSKWVLESAGPASIDVLTAALNVLSAVLTAIQPGMQWLWDNFLQPVAEWTGGVIVDVLTEVATQLQNIADLINGKISFTDFISQLNPLEIVIGSLVGIETATSTVVTVMNIAAGAAGLFSAALAAIMSPIGLIILGIAAVIAIIMNWGTISQWLSDLWTAVCTFIQEVLQIMCDYIQAKWNELSANTMLIWTIITTFLSDLWNTLVANAVAIYQAICDLIQAKWNEITAFTKLLWTALKLFLELLWNGLKTTVTTVFTAICTFVNTIWNTILTVSKTIWNAILTFIANVVDGIKTGVTNGFNAVKDTAISIFNGLKTAVSDIWNGLWGVIKGVINSILAGIESMANGVVNGINTVIDALNGLNFTIPDWVPFGLGGKTFGFSIGHLGGVSLPRLATGTVVPPNAGQFAAILGDNKTDTEVVSPLDTIKQALVEAMAESGGRQIVIRFDGSLSELARILKPELDDEDNRVGDSLVIQ